MLLKIDHKKMDKNTRILPPLSGNDFNNKQITISKESLDKDLNDS
jgi:hypothetical protein